MLEAYRHQRLDGNEPFRFNDKKLPFDALGYWRWSHSNLLDNTSRGILAEFLVASALGLTDGVRNVWDPFDLETEDGTKVEVKSSAYLQSWYQKGLSKIEFKIRPTKKWDADNNTYEALPSRQADVYVFCLLAHKDKSTVDPMALDQWRFYALGSEVLNKKLGAQKSLTLSVLQACGAIEAGFLDLKTAITAAAAQNR